MKKLIALGVSAVTAGSLYFAAPAQAGPVIPGVCVALAGLDATANFGLDQATAALAAADSNLSARRGELDTALSNYVDAVITYLETFDSGVGDLGLALAIMNARLADVGTAGSAWSSAVVAHFTATGNFDAATFNNDSIDGLISGLCGA